jgi:ribose-phosphate pyrophosphokinase
LTRHSLSVLVTGTANPELAAEVAKQTTLPLFPLSTMRFPDGELQVKLEEGVASKQVFVLQAMSPCPNKHLVETFLIIDALKRGGAKEIILVASYLAYSRQSQQEQDNVSVAAKLFAEFFQHAQVSRLVTVDLHAEDVLSFYGFPVEQVHFCKVFVQEFIKQGYANDSLVVVGPDLGSQKLALAYAQELNTPVAIMEKSRHDPRKVSILSVKGEIEEKNVLLADDVCSTAGTIVSAAKACREKGAKEIYAVVTHGVFTEDAIDRIMDSPIKKLFVSNTISQGKKTLSCPKICVISIAPVLAAAISKIST